MATLRTYVLCVLTSLAFVAPVNGSKEVGEPSAKPEFTGEITVPTTVNKGEEFTVSLLDATKAGQTVTIDIDDGIRGGQTKTVDIELNSAGAGSALVTLPDTWTPVAKFNTSQTQEKNSEVL